MGILVVSLFVLFIFQAHFIMTKITEHSTAISTTGSLGLGKPLALFLWIEDDDADDNERSEVCLLPRILVFERKSFAIIINVSARCQLMCLRCLLMLRLPPRYIPSDDFCTIQQRLHAKLALVLGPS